MGLQAHDILKDASYTNEILCLLRLPQCIKTIKINIRFWMHLVIINVMR